jgi:prepilin-type processing-associated H-X9-DG protein
MRHARFGFSLIELLVLIGIVGLLIAILLPVVNRARAMAQSTVCLAHLQQLNDSYRMYLNDNRNHSFPLGSDITSPDWFELLRPYSGNLPAILLCPRANDPGNTFGSAFLAWGPDRTYSSASGIAVNESWVVRGEYVGSYGLNAWLFAPLPEQRSTMDSEYARKMIELPARNTSRIPVLGDCILSHAFPDSGDTAPTNLIHPLPYYSGIGPKPSGPKGQMAYYCLDRHFHAVNIAFLDGHAERINLEELWKLRWNNAFVPSNVVLPR